MLKKLELTLRPPPPLLQEKPPLLLLKPKENQQVLYRPLLMRPRLPMLGQMKKQERRQLRRIGNVLQVRKRMRRQLVRLLLMLVPPPLKMLKVVPKELLLIK